jgi:hypothetical protein
MRPAAPTIPIFMAFFLKPVLIGPQAISQKPWFETGLRGGEDRLCCREHREVLFGRGIEGPCHSVVWCALLVLWKIPAGMYAFASIKYAKVFIRPYFSEGACWSVRAINRTGDQTAPIKSSNIAFYFSKWFDWKVNFFK